MMLLYINVQSSVSHGLACFLSINRKVDIFIDILRLCTIYGMLVWNEGFIPIKVSVLSSAKL